MKTIALAVVAALCAALLLNAADEPSPAPAAQASPAPAAEEKPADEKVPTPPPSRYRVISAHGFSPGPAVPGEWESHRKALEDALNKANAEGYDFAGMNGDWVVLDRRAPSDSGAPRRRVVLPVQ